MLPADVIGQVEVLQVAAGRPAKKAASARTINVTTRNPLDLESMTFDGRSRRPRIRAVRTSSIRSVAALFSWKNDAETFGFMIAGIYQKRNIRRDGVESAGLPGDRSDTGPAVNNVLAPSLIGSALFQQERVRTGGNFAVAVRAERQRSSSTSRACTRSSTPTTSTRTSSPGAAARSATAAR